MSGIDKFQDLSLYNQSQQPHTSSTPTSQTQHPSKQKHANSRVATPSTSMRRSARDYQFGTKIGEGSYSTVYSALDRHTQRTYAIKVLSKRHIVKEDKIKYVNIEKTTLHRLGQQHPGIVQLYYTFQDVSSLFFVLDFAEYGELLSIIRKFGSLSEPVSRFYMCQIVDAVRFIHSKGVIHRDLKPENILVGDDFNLKITDFGAAKLLGPGNEENEEKIDYSVATGDEEVDTNKGERSSSFVGTAEYVPPELLKYNQSGFETDIWAIGCILYQFFHGVPPFKGNTEYLTFEKIIKGEYTFTKQLPGDVVKLIDGILLPQPNSRLTIAQIMQSRWFQDIPWDDVNYIWHRKVPRFESYSPEVPITVPPPSIKNGSDRSTSKSNSYHLLQSQIQSSDYFIPSVTSKLYKPNVKPSPLQPLQLSSLALQPPQRSPVLMSTPPTFFDSKLPNIPPSPSKEDMRFTRENPTLAPPYTGDVQPNMSPRVKQVKQSVQQQVQQPVTQTVTQAQPQQPPSRQQQPPLSPLPPPPAQQPPTPQQSSHPYSAFASPRQTKSEKRQSPKSAPPSPQISPPASAAAAASKLTPKLTTPPQPRNVSNAAAAAAAAAGTKSANSPTIRPKPKPKTTPSPKLTNPTISFRTVSQLLSPNEKILKLDKIYKSILPASLRSTSELDDKTLDLLISLHQEKLTRGSVICVTVITNQARVFFIDCDLNVVEIDLKANNGSDYSMYDYEFEDEEEEDESFGYLIIECLKSGGDLLFLKRLTGEESGQPGLLEVVDKKGKVVKLGEQYGWIDCLMIAKEMVSTRPDSPMSTNSGKSSSVEPKVDKRKSSKKGTSKSNIQTSRTNFAYAAAAAVHHK
ncbi:Serine/threonine-protein kinase PKH2 [Spathaspora sp. JA1]|nr:Serine/threonine-protein kinase PKH2 [Spathaspora sp. JA1]